MGCPTRTRTGRSGPTVFCRTRPSAKIACSTRIFGTRLPLLLDYAQRELAAGERIVVNTEHWLAVVPYWAAAV